MQVLWELYKVKNKSRKTNASLRISVHWADNLFNGSQIIFLMGKSKGPKTFYYETKIKKNKVIELEIKKD
jgi:hypothetical protein